MGREIRKDITDAVSETCQKHLADTVRSFAAKSEKKEFYF